MLINRLGGRGEKIRNEKITENFREILGENRAKNAQKMTLVYEEENG